MKGRIYIGEEGINAQCTVNPGQKKALLLFLNSHPLFNNIPDIEIKATPVGGHQFPKMSVKYRKEIVALGAVYKAGDIEHHKYKASIEEFKNLIDRENPDGYLILDMRNDYEYRLGHFKNARPAGTMRPSSVSTRPCLSTPTQRRRGRIGAVCEGVVSLCGTSP